MGQRPLFADLIILPGGSASRVIKGIQLYNAQYAPRILISGFAEDIERTYNILRQYEVPESDIIVVRGGENTWNEAQYNLQYLREHNFKSVLIITDAPHTRRLRAVYATLNIDRVGITVVSAVIGDENTWWQDIEVRNFVAGEYIKMVFYFLRYDVWSWS